MILRILLNMVIINRMPPRMHTEYSKWLAGYPHGQDPMSGGCYGCTIEE